jgi:hypothetical protein
MPLSDSEFAVSVAKPCGVSRHWYHEALDELSANMRLTPAHAHCRVQACTYYVSVTLLHAHWVVFCVAHRHRKYM